MSTDAAADYRNACRELLQEAARRPSMFFRSLPELEAIMDGHSIAFRQCYPTLGACFDRDFSAWLYETTGASTAAGWVLAIKTLARRKKLANGRKPVPLFFDLVQDFLAQWGEQG